MKRSKVNFALVGYGKIGKRHAEIIEESTQAELLAICDENPELELPPSLSNCRLYSDLAKLLAELPKVDVVIIATPNGLHAQQALQSLEAGKHVLVEKPLGLCKSEVEKVIFTALHQGKHVFGVMQNRYSPPAIWLKELVDSGKLGDLYMAQINCYWNRDERYYKNDPWHGKAELDGGTLFTQFSHFIDIMYWILGDIDHIEGVMADFNHGATTDFEDSGCMHFQFVEGGIGSFNFSTSCWDQNFESSITLICENGTVKLGGQYMDRVEHCNVKNYEMPKLDPVAPPNNYGPFSGSAANHGRVIQNVIDVLSGEDRIATNALEGMKVVEIIERMYKSTKRL